MLSKEHIMQSAAGVFQQALLDRRHLHTHPELSFQEYQTSAFIKERLERLGIPFKTVGGTGVVGFIKGKAGAGRIVALRADMDALPILEKNNTVYTSSTPGIMHACGHDFHMASLLATAAILKLLEQELYGGIKLIFQPGEEVLPGGASIMIKEGVLKDPVPDIVIGQHAAPFLPAGHVGIRPGVFMASMDALRFTVKGKGGHGATPHRNTDPVVIASSIVLALQQVVSRRANPLVPTVLSIGRFIADGAVNVIPDEVLMEGTLRTVDDVWRANAKTEITRIAGGIALSMNAECLTEIQDGYPVLFNHPEAAGELRASAVDYLGADKVLEPDVWMAAEDFAYYSQEVKSCFYLTGTSDGTAATSHSLHSPSFDIKEEVLQDSAGLMAYMAIGQLQNLQQ